RGGSRRDELRRVDRTRGRARRGDRRRGALGRAGALRVVGHRGGDVGAAARTGRDPSFPRDQVRGVLPRARRLLPGRGGRGGRATLGIASSPGVPASVAEQTVVVAYNEVDQAAAAVERHGEDLAAIFVEPVAGNMGCVPPLPGFLEALRALADATGALLVFDEVITGFRVGRGGAQARYGVRPDLTILGKIVGGGLPLAAFGGHAELMSRLAPAGDVYQAGTLSGNPLATAAGLSVLRRLRDPAVYDELERRGALLEAGLSPFGLVQRVGAMLTFFAGSDPSTVVTRFEQFDPARYGELFRGLLERGIYVAPSQYECLFPSLAHGDEEIQATVEAVGEPVTGWVDRGPGAPREPALGTGPAGRARL